MRPGVEDWIRRAGEAPDPADVIGSLARAGLRIGIAESLTGGLVAAELIRTPGASAVVLGAVVAYATPLKHTLLGVDAGRLASHGPVDPVVAVQMAEGIRRAVRIDGRDADVGVSTTGVAGPDPQGGKSPGTVFIGVSIGETSAGYELSLEGDREAIRRATVAAVLRMILAHTAL